jgi:uncharacterized membrane protein
MAAELGYALDISIKILVVIVLLISTLILYRLDRVIASGMNSAEMVERTAENVERSSEKVLGVVAFAEKIPFTGSKKSRGGKEDE